MELAAFFHVKPISPWIKELELKLNEMRTLGHRMHAHKITFAMPVNLRTSEWPTGAEFETVV